MGSKGLPCLRLKVVLMVFLSSMVFVYTPQGKAANTGSGVRNAADSNIVIGKNFHDAVISIDQTQTMRNGVTIGMAAFGVLFMIILLRYPLLDWAQTSYWGQFMRILIPIFIGFLFAVGGAYATSRITRARLKTVVGNRLINSRTISACCSDKIDMDNSLSRLSDQAIDEMENECCQLQELVGASEKHTFKWWATGGIMNTILISMATSYIILMLLVYIKWNLMAFKGKKTTEKEGGTER